MAFKKPKVRFPSAPPRKVKHLGDILSAFFLSHHPFPLVFFVAVVYIRGGRGVHFLIAVGCKTPLEAPGGFRNFPPVSR